MLRKILLTAGLLGAAIVGTQAQNMPFPQNKIYSYGLMPTNRNSTDASSAYTIWKTNFLLTCTNGRLRVKFDDGVSTVSEGIGYGMLLSAYMGDKVTFDGLWLYYKDNRNANGVMNWKMGGCTGATGLNGATDSEFDCAMALVVAKSQWASTGTINYNADAIALITAIKNKEIEATTFVTKAGDAFGGSNLVNPSYLAPAYCRAFGAFMNDATFWNNVAAKSYVIINNNLTANSAVGGIVMDWCKADGTSSPDAAGYVNGGTKYTYDACRTPWRIAVDYAWYGNASALTYAKKCSDFVRVNLGGSANIKDGYNQNGTVSGQWHNSAFVGAFASAAMAGANQTHLNSSYSDLLACNDASSYYNQTLKTLYLCLLSGNFYLPGTTSCPTQAIPNAALFVVRNSWADDGLGSGVTTDATNGLNITHRQYGETYLWVIESGKSTAMVSGKYYNVTFDFKNDATTPVSGINVGFATVVGTNNPTLAQPAVAAATGFPSTFTTKTVSILATSSTTAYLAFSLNWTIKPGLTVNTFIKNIKVCESTISARMDNQDLEESAVATTEHLSIYPNAFTEHTSVLMTTDLNMPLSIEVYDMQGNTVLSTHGSTNHHIQVGGLLMPGHYMMKVAYGDKVLKSALIKK